MLRENGLYATRGVLFFRETHQRVRIAIDADLIQLTESVTESVIESIIGGARQLRQSDVAPPSDLFYRMRSFHPLVFGKWLPLGMSAGRELHVASRAVPGGGSARVLFVARSQFGIGQDSESANNAVLKCGSSGGEDRQIRG